MALYEVVTKKLHSTNTVCSDKDMLPVPPTIITGSTIWYTCDQTFVGDEKKKGKCDLNFEIQECVAACDRTLCCVNELECVGH